MYWYYSEGELTVKLDGEEHKFSLEQLIRDSSAFKERRRTIKIVFSTLFFSTLFLQLYGGGIPKQQDIYFYIGYFATPLFIAGFVSFLAYAFLKYKKKEVSKLDSMFQEFIS
tara:strand:- start:778 stop:1113 length:336 start_codon:yes stop_codon:yes gene_type:complete